VNLGTLYHTAITQGWGIEYKTKLADESRKLEKNARLNSKKKKINTREQKLKKIEIYCVKKQSRNSRCSISEKKDV
jgi:hypothetical protein